jgi:hypothetical protein
MSPTWPSQKRILQNMPQSLERGIKTQDQELDAWLKWHLPSQCKALSSNPSHAKAEDQERRQNKRARDRHEKQLKF